MVHRGQQDQADDALAWDEQVGPSRPAQGPVLRLWLRAAPAWVLGVVLVTAATAWPWLLLMGWLHRGGAYFWWFGLGCLLVVTLTWLRFLDERALRAVGGIRGPSVQRERELTDALIAAGAPPATVWLGRVGTDRTLCLATPTRCHVVVPLEPSVDGATASGPAASPESAETLPGSAGSTRPMPWTPSRRRSPSCRQDSPASRRRARWRRSSARVTGSRSTAATPG